MLHVPILARLTARLVVILWFVTLLSVAPTGARPASASAPALGSAQSFSVLGGSTVTNTGSSIVSGNLGVSPGSAVTGFPPGLVKDGTIHAADAIALQAQSDVTIAYNNLAGQSCTADLTGQDLGGLTLTTGVYCFSSSAQLTGTLSLDAQGNASAVFIFKIGSTLTTASGSRVTMINGGSACNVFWQVGSSATVGTGTAFAGNILALTSITLNTGASVAGRALARNGAVTMQSNTVAGCATGSTACNNDGRVNGKCGDRVAVWCDSDILEVWGVGLDSKGFTLFDFKYADIVAAGPKGLSRDLGPLGVVSVSVDAKGNFWVAWNGKVTLPSGSFFADGQPDHGFAKGFWCSFK